MSKDWNGNYHSIYVTLGASNHVDFERQKEDYYATEPKALELLLDIMPFNKKVWEPACGEGHLSEVLIKRGYEVTSTDLIDRGYGKGDVDFLGINEKWGGDIITNPPYKYALDFVKHSLDLVSEGSKVAMFLKLQFLEGKERKKFFMMNPPKYVYVSASRLKCAMNGNFETVKGSAVAYAWFVWEKGYKGDSIIKWFN